jgi:hypothetical protein
MRDLVVLTACQHSKFAVKAILGRTHSLSIRAIDANFIVHPESDPGCFNTSHTLLRSQINEYRYALVIFDREGSGREQLTALQIANKVRTQLEQNGWDDRAAVVVIDPELEAWVWSDSPHVDRILGWDGRIPPLRTWLVDSGHTLTVKGVPVRPKEALQAALQESKLRHSSAIFDQLGRSVSLDRCGDKSFRRLCVALRTWFPAS